MPKKERLAKASIQSRTEILNRIQNPDTIKVSGFESAEWRELANGPEGKSWQAARGIVQAWVKGGDRANALRTTAFEGIDPVTAREAFRSLVTDELMLPIETKFAKKFGDMTAVNYDLWADKVHSLWKTTTWKPNLKLLFQATNEVTKELANALEQSTGNNKIVPMTAQEALEKVTKGKNSGWPFFTSKWSEDPEMLSYYMEKAELLLNGVDTLAGTPHILFKRVQANGLEDNPKMRAVECPPKHDAIASKALTDRFIDVFKTMETYYGFNGGENVHKILKPFMSYEYLIEGDFSSFDQNCQQMMSVVFSVIEQLIPDSYQEYLKITLKYYQNSILITPQGIITGKDGKINGLNSGDGWTSVIGTIANAIATKYAMKRMEVDDYRNLAFGDDIAIAANYFNVEVFEASMKELGLECNQSKQNCSDGDDAYFSFLGYYHFRSRWEKGNKGIFPIMRVATGLYFKERYSDDIHGDDEQKHSGKAVRLMGYAMQLNVCREHNDFKALVTLFRENEPERMNVSMILSVKTLAMALRSHRTSRTTSIENSEVIKELMRLDELESVLPSLQEVETKLVKLTTYPHCLLTQAPKESDTVIPQGQCCNLSGRIPRKEKIVAQGPCCQLSQKPGESTNSMEPTRLELMQKLQELTRRNQILEGGKPTQI